MRVYMLRIWVGCLALAFMGGCAPSDTRSTLERIREDSVVRIGYANEAPYAYKDTRTGKVTGEAPEIARVVLAELGVQKVEGVLTEFGSLIPGLKAGRFDVIAAGMYIKPERCGQIAFSNPTYAIGEALAVQTGNPLNIHSYQDIKDHPEATIGVVAGAVERGYARAVGIPEDRIIVFPDARSALAGVRASRVTAYAGTALTVQDLISKDTSGKIERAVPFTNPVINGEQVKGYGAFGFRKNDQELVGCFNEVLADYIGSEEHLSLVKPFGFTAAELPQGVTADELCEAAP